MNSAILHSARPDKEKKRTKLPKAAVQFAKQMGLDLTDLQSEAEDIWNMLDEMSVKDPNEYSNFVQEQFENSKIADAEKEGKKFFRPKAGICIRVISTGGDGIKVRDASKDNEKNGKKLFINICSHEALEPPTDGSGRPVLDDRADADGLSFPLLIGPLRDTEDGDGAPALAVDVLFHPSVIQKCITRVKFKKQVVDLAMTWVVNETGVSFMTNWQSLQTSYMGGRGHDRDTPVLFSVDHALQQSDGHTDSNVLNATETTATGGSKNVSAVTKSLVSPQSLLRLVKEEQSQSGTGEESIIDIRIDAPNPKTIISSTKPMIVAVDGIEDVLDESETTAASATSIRNHDEDRLIDTIASSNMTKSSNQEIKSKPLMKKGFLTKTTVPLYPEGSSEGSGNGQGGTYARFMDKCKIVDTSKMSPEEVQAMTRQHALGPKSVAAAPVAAIATKNSAIPSASKPSKVDKRHLKEMEDLLRRADEDYGQQCRSEDEGKQFVAQEQLKELANLLSMSEDRSAPPLPPISITPTVPSPLQPPPGPSPPSPTSPLAYVLENNL